MGKKGVEKTVEMKISRSRLLQMPSAPHGQDRDLPLEWKKVLLQASSMDTAGCHVLQPVKMHWGGKGREVSSGKGAVLKG